MEEYVEYDGTTYQVLLNDKWDNGHNNIGERKYIFFDCDMCTPNRALYKKIKTKYINEKNMKLNIPCVSEGSAGFSCITVDECISFDTSPIPVATGWVQLQPNNKENNMGYDNIEYDQRNHLKRRLDAILSNKVETIAKKFNRDEPEGPQTKDDLLAALSSGKFTLNAHYFDKNGKLSRYENGRNALSWRTADTQFDEAGFDAAYDLLTASYTTAKDAALVLPVADGLKALQTFEAQSF